MAVSFTTLASVRSAIKATVGEDTYSLLSESITTAGEYSRTGAKFTAQQTLAMVAILDATITGDADTLPVEIVAASDLWKLTTAGYRLAGLLSDGSPYFTHVSKLVRMGKSSADILDYLTSKDGKVRGLSSLQAWVKDLAAAEDGEDKDGEDGEDKGKGKDISKLMATVLRNLESVADAHKAGAILDAGQWAQLRLIASGIERREVEALKVSAPAPKVSTPAPKVSGRVG